MVENMMLLRKTRSNLTILARMQLKIRRDELTTAYNNLRHSFGMQSPWVCGNSDAKLHTILVICPLGVSLLQKNVQKMHKPILGFYKNIFL